MITPQRLRVYPWLVLVASWSIIAINFITRMGWRGGFGQIIGQDFLTLYSAGWLYRNDIQHLYELSYQGGVEQALISPTKLEGVNPYISPPYVALAYSSFTLLSLPAAFAVWQVISLLCALVAAAWLVRLMPPRLQQTGLRGWQWSIILLSFFPLVQGWLVGQNHTLTLLLLTGVLLFTLKEQPVLAGTMAGLTIFKPQFALGFLIVWVVWRQWRSLLAFAGIAVVWAGLVVLQHGIGSYQTYFTGIDDILQIQSMPGFPDYLLVTPYGLLSTLLPETTLPIPQWIPVVFLLLVAFLLAWLAWRSKSGSFEERLPALTLAVLFPLIATPYALFHDLLVLLPVLVLMAWYGECRFLAVTAVALYLGSLVLPSLAYFLQVALLAIFPIVLFSGLLRQVFIQKGTSRTGQGVNP